MYKPAAALCSFPKLAERLRSVEYSPGLQFERSVQHRGSRTKPAVFQYEQYIDTKETPSQFLVVCSEFV
jgi:hypothetical protein